MPKMLITQKGKSLLNYILHFSFNCLLAIASISITALTGNAILGIFFVILSKWRMFAVHPYHWLSNISAGSVDLIIGTSFTLLALPAKGASPDILPIHLLLIISYILWLSIIKPGTSLKFAEAQSLIAIFFGTNTTVILFSKINPLVTALIFFICFAAFKHLLLQTEETHLRTPSTIFALLLTWVAWILQFWLIVYGFESSGIVISQISFILTLITFAIFRIYLSFLRNDGTIRTQDIIAPTIFSAIIILIMLFIFSNPIFNI